MLILFDQIAIDGSIQPSFISYNQDMVILKQMDERHIRRLKPRRDEGSILSRIRGYVWKDFSLTWIL